MTPAVYSVAEAAEALGVSRDLVREALRRGWRPLPSFRLGNRVLVPVEGLKAWVLEEAGINGKEVEREKDKRHGDRG